MSSSLSNQTEIELQLILDLQSATRYRDKFDLVVSLLQGETPFRLRSQSSQ